MQLATVLIVDDNKDLAHALKVRLTANGYQVFLAHNGVSAAALALAENPLAILLDLHLAEEDGLVVMKMFRDFPKLDSVPVIIVSADRSAITQQQVYTAGAHAFLEKPVDHHLLVSLLRAIHFRLQNEDCPDTTALSNSL